MIWDHLLLPSTASTQTSTKFGWLIILVFCSTVAFKVYIYMWEKPENPDPLLSKSPNLDF